MASIGPGKLKSKPNLIRISSSMLTRSDFEIVFFSFSLSRLIILENEGCIGCSSFAASSIQIVDKLTILFKGKFQCPKSERYLSNMQQAQKRVSILYPFSL